LGVVEAELVRMKEARSGSGAALSTSDSRRSKPESGSELMPPLKEKEKSGAAGHPATAGLPGGEEIYKAALDDYARGDYDLAISGFRSYVAKYPKGTLAANSQYWLGECYYSQKKLEQSIIEFDTVLKQYPSSEKARSALLKKGYAYLASGNVAKGKSALREVMEKYPGTQEASLAESRMANLK
jgi:tol-pal system protein YbgF